MDMSDDEAVAEGLHGIDRTLPKEERIKDFIRQIKNPYCYKCGDVVVKVEFSDTDLTLEDCMEHYLRMLDGELRETQTTDYFSKHRRSDCAVRELTAR